MCLSKQKIVSIAALKIMQDDIWHIEMTDKSYTFMQLSTMQRYTFMHFIKLFLSIFVQFE